MRNVKKGLISILLIIALLGCIQISTANIQTGDIISAPKTPITVKLSLSSLPALNGMTDATITVSSVRDANNTNVDLILPDGVVSVGKKPTWNIDLKANVPVEFTTKIKVTKNGNLDIRATAKSVIDENETWGDTSMAYLGVNENIAKSPYNVPRAALAEGINTPKNVKIISKELKIDNSVSNLPAPVRDPNAKALKVTANTPGYLDVSGAFFYWTKAGDYRDSSDTEVPAQYFLAYVVDGNGNLLGYGWTDSNGYFTASVPNPGAAGIRVRWYAYDNPGALMMVVPEGKGGAWSDAYYAETPTLGPFADGAIDIGGWDLIQHHALEGAFWIKDDIERAWISLGGEAGGGIVEWSYTGTVGTYYNAGEHIHLAGIDRESRDTSVHEYGHNVMYNVYGAWPPGTPGDTGCPSPHYVEGVSSHDCAWTEGWADFLPLYANGDPYFTWPGGYGLNMETATWGSYWDNGDDVEGRVAGALYDVYDSNNDGTDTMSDGIGNIWNTFKDSNLDGLANDNTFPQFYDNLKSKYSSSQDLRAALYQNTIDYDTAPAGVGSPSPTDGAIDTLNDFSTSWATGGDADGDIVTYTEYLDTNPYPTTMKCTITSTSCPTSVLLPGTKYYWRVDASDDMKTTPGPVWSFTTAAASPASITVTSPNGGDTWVRGTAYPITWTSTGDIGANVKIELLKGGIPVGTVAASTPNDGSQSWTVSSTRALGTDYKIKISSVSNPTITDTSDSDFTIGGINVNLPNGGETWVRGTANTITWSSAGIPGPNVKIELLKNGVSVGVVASSTPNDGSQSWTVSSTRALGSDYKIRVTSTTNPAYKDTSNNNFVIGGINVDVPNGGETWARGTAHTITWSKLGSPGANVKIELLKNGISVGTVASSTPNDGSQPWTVSAGRTPGIDYKIRVTSTTNALYKDTSNNNFIIS